MWYHFDPVRFAREMLPPLLRSDVLLALLQSVLRPLTDLLEEFARYRESVHIRLNTTGQSYSLSGALTAKYRLPEGVIYITDTGDTRLYLYFLRERRAPWTLYREREEGETAYLRGEGEGKYSPDFIVHLPAFLRDEEEEIRRFIARYKPAGRIYELAYYDYE